MGFLIGLLTLVMVLTCFVLVFLILLQLPKKDAGAGLAFGGAATDALFGAGAGGNMLTKITKYLAALFFILAIVLSIMQSFYHRRGAADFRKLLAQPGKLPAAATAPATTTPTPTPTLPETPLTAPGTNLLTIPGTNLLTAPGTNPLTAVTNLLISAPPATPTNRPATPAVPTPAAPTNPVPAPVAPK